LKRLFQRKKLFLFDLDGVFYKGKESRTKIGGTKAIESLRKLGRQLYIVTNNSTDSVETIHSRLLEYDIPVKKEEILTSGLLTAEYLNQKHGIISYFLVGEGGLDHEMRKYGHRRATGEKADFVVVGLDRQITYDKLDRAARLARNGAGIIATHVSRLYMYKTGPAMATGPIVKAIEFASQKRAVVIGKPSPLMFRIALKRAGRKASEALMVGDQVDTDIAGATRAGMDSVLVTSGIDNNPGRYKPLVILPTVDDIVPLL
jgi:HAD superfamily hydrolase (TIGR01450 family)